MATLLNNSTRKALTTLARTKAFLGIGSDKHDTILIMLVNQASGFIERYLKRSLLSQTYTNEEYDGSGTNTLVLKQFPVTAVASLQVNTSGDSTASWQTIDTKNYFSYEDGRIMLNNPVAGFLDQDAGTFIPHPQKYRVTYTAGYLIDFDNENTPGSHTLPEDIEYACLKLVSALFNTRRAEGYTQARVGDQSMSMRGAIMGDKELKDILGTHVSATI